MANRTLPDIRGGATEPLTEERRRTPRATTKQTTDTCLLLEVVNAHHSNLLSLDDAVTLAALGVRHEYGKGHIIAAQDRNLLSVLFLLAGTANVEYSNGDGKVAVLQRLSGGDFFGEQALLDEPSGQRASSLRATSSCSVLRVPSATFLYAASQTPSLNRTLVKMLAARLQQSLLKTESLAMMTVQARVHIALVNGPCTAASSGVILHTKVSASALSKEVGASREIVSRAIGQLKLDGIISTSPQGQTIVQYGNIPERYLHMSSY